MGLVGEIEGRGLCTGPYHPGAAHGNWDLSIGQRLTDDGRA
jgi:hypothetical protein